LSRFRGGSLSGRIGSGNITLFDNANNTISGLGLINAGIITYANPSVPLTRSLVGTARQHWHARATAGGDAKLTIANRQSVFGDGAICNGT
jgi:hypothetical protein